ncbi:MAG TPA: NAD(P)H-quinone oxidoreductase, partial [Deltaproteobacteria bacterium]|nr:NAD(P)H-quinone oxidoreductase [Deltaproteobacteria bacterium]
RLAAPDGRVISIAFLRGSRSDVDFMPVMMKRLTLMGSTLRARSSVEKDRIARLLLKYLWPRVEAGEVRPVMATHFPLSAAADAHRLMESSGHIGKIVLTIEGR